MNLITLGSNINDKDIQNILEQGLSPSEDMVLEIISDWKISSEPDNTYRDALRYIHDELINGPEDYDFSFREVNHFILRFFK